MKKKQRKSARLTAEAQKRIAALVADHAKRLKAPRKKAMALVAVGVSVVLATPDVATKELVGFQYPRLDENDLPLGGYEVIDVTVLMWATRQHDSRWDFMYRPSGETVWRKPPIVSENARLGIAAVVLRQGSYEFLPLARV